MEISQVDQKLQRLFEVLIWLRFQHLVLLPGVVFKEYHP